jgi:hypothetical protein
MVKIPKFNYAEFFKSNRIWFLAILIMFAINIVLILLLTENSNVPGYIKVDRPDGQVFVHPIGVYFITISAITLNVTLFSLFAKAVIQYIKGSSSTRI